MLAAALGCGRCGGTGAARLGRGRLRLRFRCGARVGNERRLRGRAAAPVFDLRMHHRGRFARRADRLDLIGRRNAQDRTALQRVDVVLVERVRVLLEQREHQLVDVRRIVRLHLARDAGQRVACLHRVFVGARGFRRGCGRRSLRRGRRFLGLFRARRCGNRRRLRRRRHGFRLLGRWRCRALGRFRRLRDRGGRARGGRHDRRVEQHGVFAKQAALRPVRFDEEIEEWLADDFLAGDLDHHVAVRTLDQRELERHREARAVEAHAIEVLGRGELHEQALGFALRALQDRDLRVERLVQLGIDVNRAEAQGEGIRPA